MKVTITLDDVLMERIDGFADDNYMSRSGFISLACSNYLNAKDLQASVKTMGQAFKKIAEKGEFDHETIQQLEDFQRLCSLVSNSSLD